MVTCKATEKEEDAIVDGSLQIVCRRAIVAELEN